MIEFSTKALGLLVLYRHLDVVTHLEINLTTMPIHVSFYLFLCLLYGRISRFLGLVYTLYHGLDFLSI